jgi:putative lipase involved disintegration of autophagic bodies
MAKIRELAVMSEQAYEKNGGQAPAGWQFVTDSFSEGIGGNFGYYGAVYQNLQTGEIVIAHRGTEFSQSEDVESLLKAALKKGLPQFLDAERFYQRVLTTRLGPSFTGSIVHTGHSQGGGIAGLMGARTGEAAVGFNSIGVKGVLSRYGLDPNASYANILNIHSAFDPANLVGVQIGVTRDVYVSSYPLVPDPLERIFTDEKKGSGLEISVFNGGVE